MNNTSQCCYFKFGLLVTGDTEEKHLPALFRTLMETGICTFEVIRKIDQRSPITSERRQLKMVGSGQIIPNKDQGDIGFPSRTYLSRNPCAYVLLIDDLEHNRKDQVEQIFQRYRQALNTILSDEQQQRASVHFLVNMIEAYYFADAQAINQVLGTNLADHSEDVETIRHPKGELKQIFPKFDEVLHGGDILKCLNVNHVLSRPETCASLRTLFSWCVKILQQYPHKKLFVDDEYCLINGNSYSITDGQ
jgi:hypothetical protein